jgi:hypothetical protein
MDDMGVPPLAADMQIEGEILSSWLQQQRTTILQQSKVLGLMDIEWMRSFPLPPRTIQQEGAPEYKWLRFLFRRHVQHILNWTHRRSEGSEDGFGTMDDLVRNCLFPGPLQTADRGDNEESDQG